MLYKRPISLDNENILHLDVQDKYFHAIRNGLKKIEGRLGKKKYLNLRPKDKICFMPTQLSLLSTRSLEEEKTTVICEVVKTIHYSSFREMFEKEGVAAILPEETSIDKGLAIYSQFYSKADEELYGVAAIFLKKI